MRQSQSNGVPARRSAYSHAPDLTLSQGMGRTVPRWNCRKRRSTSAARPVAPRGIRSVCGRLPWIVNVHRMIHRGGWYDL